MELNPGGGEIERSNPGNDDVCLRIFKPADPFRNLICCLPTVEVSGDFSVLFLSLVTST